MFTWHAVNSYVYHTSFRCTEGNNIELWNWRSGTGGKVQCLSCWWEEYAWQLERDRLFGLLSTRR